MKIGSTIKRLRKQKGFTQQEMSQLTGISQTSLSQIEGDVTYPHQSTLRKILNKLEVSEKKFYSELFKS